MQEKEEWRDISGFEGLYQVSSFGRVKSLTDWHGNKHLNKRVHREKVLSLTDNGFGYLIVGLRKDGKRKSCYVHRLVASAFLENPNQLPVVNHIDFDKQNNMVSNLEWCTQKENVCCSAERMRKRRTVTHSSTGEQYIYYRASSGLYRVVVDHKEYKAARTLEEAISRRDEILRMGVVL